MKASNPVTVEAGRYASDSVLAYSATSLAALKSVTRTRLRECFRRHISEVRLTLALLTLARAGVITGKRVKSGGRPSEVWTWAG